MKDCYKTVIKTCDSFLDVGHSILKPISHGKDYLYRKVAVLLLSKMGYVNWEIAEFLQVGERSIYRDLEYCAYNFDFSHFQFAYNRCLKLLKRKHRNCSKRVL